MEATTDTTGPRRDQRNYTDKEQAEALAALQMNGNNAEKTAAEIGIPARTLRSWRRQEARPTIGNDRQELATQKREQLTRGVRKLTRRVLKKALKVAASDEPVSLRDATVALGICVDKLQNLTGENQSSPAVVVNVNPQSLTITAADLAALRALMGEPPQTLAIEGNSGDTSET